MEKLLNIKQVSEILNVSKESLRNWDKNNILHAIKTNGKHRRWKESDIKKYLGKIESKENVLPVAIYARVSSHDQKQKGDLDRQSQRLYEYCIKKKYKIEYSLKDVGSGLSDSRKNLLKLFDLIANKKISKVIIENKDRLTRFQFNFFEYFFKSYNVEIEIISKKDINENEELVEDIMMLMASFSGKIHGKRSAKRRKRDDN